MLTFRIFITMKDTSLLIPLKVLPFKHTRAIAFVIFWSSKCVWISKGIIGDAVVNFTVIDFKHWSNPCICQSHFRCGLSLFCFPPALTLILPHLFRILTAAQCSIIGAAHWVHPSPSSRSLPVSGTTQEQPDESHPWVCPHHPSPSSAFSL